MEPSYGLVIARCPALGRSLLPAAQQFSLPRPVPEGATAASEALQELRVERRQ
ncbi:MAG: hypothetical protein ACYCYK_11400 [Candidatus Dormibacteria bacterium]